MGPARAWTGSVAAVLLLVPGWTGEVRRDRLRATGTIHAARVPLDAADPARVRAGRLVYEGGVVLTSGDPAFGGFSSLAVEGDRFTLLSDGGQVARFSMRGDWRPFAVRFSELPAGPGQGWLKDDRDSESLAIGPGGRAWVGFENHNEIWRYAPGFARAEARVAPEAMHRWAADTGAESLVRLADGRFVVISEQSHRELHDALVFTGDPTSRPIAFRFRYRAPTGYEPSDATQLPDGSLVIVNRRFQLPFRFTAMLTRVPLAAIRPDAVVRGEPLALLGPPLLHDNYEGIAAVPGLRGATTLWLVSDDNQSLLERTLLLRFRLPPDR